MEKRDKGDGSNQAGVVRKVYVGPLEARREMLAVCGMIIVVIALMAFRFSIVASTSTDETLKSYQRFDGVLESQVPILYRSLLSSVGEICDLRDIEGAWPSADSLKEESIPPFAADFLPVGLQHYTWTRHDGGTWVDYYGTSEADAETLKAMDHEPVSLVLRIIDLRGKQHPHPHVGIDNDPDITYATQVWIYFDKRPYPGEEMIKKGWKWIISANDPFLGAGKVISESPEKAD